MANLKELRIKIGGIRAIRKVTAAMKLVAGVKLRKAEQRALASKPYANELKKILATIKRENLAKSYELFDGRESVKSEVLIAFASDKGFCGNFNYLLGKKLREIVTERREAGVKVEILCVGNKLYQMLRHALSGKESLELVADFYKGEVLENSRNLAARVIEEFRKEAVDRVSLVFTHYYSAMRMTVGEESLIPLKREENKDITETIFEPSADEVLENLLPYNLGIQIYQAALESMASEQSSRMRSMDNATRNADEMLGDLTIRYNRTRQYGITQELTEVVAGASAVAND
ncbi:MAG: ATP synthase F1 subunit gamma [Alphaproteobacteria bacterium]|nr:ATP synthase F1 subunit gamma [Alphaproteobacteria bacterium]